jgi:hypothetical protein
LKFSDIKTADHFAEDTTVIILVSEIDMMKKMHVCNTLNSGFKPIN